MHIDRAFVMSAVCSVFAITERGVGRWSALFFIFLFVGDLFYLGSKPFAVNLIPSPWDKLGHLVAFGIIAGLLWLGLLRKHPLWVIFLVTIIGSLDELHQHYFLPGRSGDLADLLADVLAAVLTVTMLHLISRAIARKKH